MKRTLLNLLFLLSALRANAMSYEEARQQAWFLTDKMAYELNLTSDQYDHAYQINLDYLMSVDSPNDCTGYYWQYRDTDLRCILFDWQYNLYRTLDYFFRPVRWYQSRWYYPVFDHYRYGYYYFDRPNGYVSYTSGLWRRRSHNDPSPYIALRPHRGVGMRDQYGNRGWYGGSDHPNNPPLANHPQPNGRNNHGQGNGNRPFNYNDNRGARLGSSNASPNGVNHADGQRNNKKNNGNNSSPYRDAYTNYRQTGNSTPTSGRTFSMGSATVNRNGASGATNNNTSTTGRSTRDTNASSTSNAGRNNSGRTFGR